MIAGLILASTAIPVAAIAASRFEVITAAVAVGIGVVLVFAIALTRFEFFTLLLIGARTAIDITHSSESTEALGLSVFVTGAYAVAAIVWLLARRIRQPLTFSRLAIAAMVVSCAALLSAALSTDRSQAALGASRWVFIALLIVVLENLIVDEIRVRRLVVAIVASTLVPLAVGTWQLVTGGGRLVDGIIRIEGTFAHPNTYGFYLAVVAIGLIAISSHIKNAFRVPIVVLIVVILVNLVATYSRTSYVALAVGLLVVGLTARRWALLVVTAAMVVVVSLIPSVSERFADLGDGSTVRGTPGDSLSWRFDYWEDVFQAGAGRRVTGLGFGVVSDTTEQGREPHNDLLRAYVELGTVGLVAYLAFLLALGLHIRRAFAGSKAAAGRPGLSRALAVGNAGIFFAYLIGSITGNLMTQLILLLYVVAFAMSVGPSVRRDGRQGSTQLAPSHV